MEKTTALGPVAIGSMNAVLHAMQAGTSMARGCRLAACAAGIRTGMRMVAVAVLLAISVRKVTVQE